MLCLSRKKNESIRISDDITITVIAIRHGAVMLGIEAPKLIPVHREEVFERIHRQMEEGVPLQKIEEQLDLEDNCEGD